MFHSAQVRKPCFGSELDFGLLIRIEFVIESSGFGSPIGLELGILVEVPWGIALLA